MKPNIPITKIPYVKPNVPIRKMGNVKPSIQSEKDASWEIKFNPHKSNATAVRQNI